MQSLKSRILLIGSWDKKLTESGATIYQDLQSASTLVDLKTFDVIAISITSILEKKFSQFYANLRQENQCAQLIAVAPKGYSSQTLADLHKTYSFFQVIDSFHETDIEKHLYEALEYASQKHQNEHLNQLLTEQNNKLRHLQLELEDRVEKRTRSLAESRHNLHIRNLRLEGLRRALIAIYEANSISEIEKQLNDSLHGSVETSWIRIVASSQDQQFQTQIESLKGFAFLRIALYREHNKIGSIFFMRSPDRPFKRDDTDFLNKVSDAVSLAMYRISKLKETESVKEQWDATFNAISEPVALIDENFNIVQANSNIKPDQKCYTALFQRQNPCPGCQRGGNFRLVTDENENKTYEVHSQTLAIENNRPPTFFHMYHDISQQLKMEKQIVETAKMAELGTIGSSIAHELNNPLGGILSFTQIIKMEMAKSEPLYEDIAEIESGALRCKDIIQNLLSFTRDPNLDAAADIELAQVCRRALKIMEIQTRALGIEIQIHQESENSSYMIHGHLNLLSQALKNMLQVSIALLSQQNQQVRGFRGKIEFRLSQQNNLIVLHISDNAGNSEARGLLFAQVKNLVSKIFNDHKAQLEISAESSPEPWAKISFSRLVLGS